MTSARCLTSQGRSILIYPLISSPHIIYAYLNAHWIQFGAQKLEGNRKHLANEIIFREGDKRIEERWGQKFIEPQFNHEGKNADVALGVTSCGAGVVNTGQKYKGLDSHGHQFTLFWKQSYQTSWDQKEGPDRVQMRVDEVLSQANGHGNPEKDSEAWQSLGPWYHESVVSALYCLAVDSDLREKKNSYLN
jgi:hypothetical protein